MLVCYDRKNINIEMINKEGIEMVKDGEDWNWF